MIGYKPKTHKKKRSCLLRWLNHYNKLPFLFLFLGVVLSGCQWFEGRMGDKIQPLEVHTQGLEYQVIWSKNLDEKIRKTLEKESILLRLKHRSPISLAGLLKRCKKDEKSFKKGLASIGYFEGTVKVEVNDQVNPIDINLQIDPGPRYRLGKTKIKNTDLMEIDLSLSPSKIADITGLKKKSKVDLAKVIKGGQRLKKYLQERGYAFVEIKIPQGKLNKKDRILNVIYIIDLNSLHYIQETAIEGLQNLQGEYIRNRILWKEGDLFSQDKIDKTRRKLLETGLFSNISIHTEKGKETGQRLKPVKLTVKASEGTMKAIGAGAKFSTSEGIGGHAFWHHNNIKGNGQHLGFSFRSSKHESKTEISYDVPDFGQPLQVMKNEALILLERTKAYVGKSYSIGSGIQRPLNDQLAVSLSLIGEEGRIRKQDQIYKTRLVGIPGEFKADFTNNLLDPNHGIKGNIKITPYLGRVGRTRGMVVGFTSLSGYIPFFTNEIDESPFILASFFRGGSIFNQPLNSIPPTKRFYAGGGGSIRGYGYQMLGPLDNQGAPRGGKSLIEIGTELRIRPTETIGFVVFAEGGSVAERRIPTLSKELLWGSGFGMRYYSPLGPIRVDIALPMNRRKDARNRFIDSPFQIYFSVGQAF